MHDRPLPPLSQWEKQGNHPVSTRLQGQLQVTSVDKLESAIMALKVDFGRPRGEVVEI